MSFIPITVTIKGARLMTKERKVREVEKEKGGKRKERWRRKKEGREIGERGRNRKGKGDIEAVNKK